MLPDYKYTILDIFYILRKEHGEENVDVDVLGSVLNKFYAISAINEYLKQENDESEEKRQQLVNIVSKYFLDNKNERVQTKINKIVDIAMTMELKESEFHHLLPSLYKNFLLGPILDSIGENEHFKTILSQVQDTSKLVEEILKGDKIENFLKKEEIEKVIQKIDTTNYNLWQILENDKVSSILEQPAIKKKFEIIEETNKHINDILNQNKIQRLVADPTIKNFLDTVKTLNSNVDKILSTARWSTASIIMALISSSSIIAYSNKSRNKK